LNSANFQIFLHELAHAYQNTLNSVVMETGSCHKANALILPDNVVCLFWPPYSPELNPVERLWQDRKDQLAWLLATAIAELARQVETIIRH
jgi:transposase